MASEVVDEDDTPSTKRRGPQLQKKISVDTNLKTPVNNNQNLTIPEGSQADDGLSPEIKSKTYLAMENKDLKNIESKVREHIKKEQKKKD